MECIHRYVWWFRLSCFQIVRKIHPKKIIMEVLVDAVTKKLFSFICHQNVDILFDIGERTINLCPRCAGLHLGFSSALLVLMYGSVTLRPSMSIFLVGLAVVPAIHWLLGNMNILNPDAFSRFGTGLIGGLAFAAVLKVWRMSNLSKARMVLKPGIYAAYGSITALLLLLGTGVWVTVSLILLLAVLLNFIFIADTLMSLTLMHFNKLVK